MVSTCPNVDHRTTRHSVGHSPSRLRERSNTGRIRSPCRRALSSVGQSTCLTCRRSGVRVPQRPLVVEITTSPQVRGHFWRLRLKRPNRALSNPCAGISRLRGYRAPTCATPPEVRRGGRGCRPTFPSGWPERICAVLSACGIAGRAWLWGSTAHVDLSRSRRGRSVTAAATGLVWDWLSTRGVRVRSRPRVG